jgi:hypothetical protein
MAEQAPGTRNRRRDRLAVLIAGALVAVVFAGCVGQAVPPTSSAPRTAAEACHPPATADKGSGAVTFAWQIAVETDRPDGSVLLFSSGDNTLLCRVGRTQEGAYGPTVTAIGTHTGDEAAGITLDSGMGSPQGAASILVGRVPAGTASVRLGFVDGTEEAAVVGGGYWLGWPSVPANPISIEALDASGAVIDRLADPHGVPFPE